MNVPMDLTDVAVTQFAAIPELLMNVPAQSDTMVTDSHPPTVQPDALLMLHSLQLVLPQLQPQQLQQQQH